MTETGFAVVGVRNFADTHIENIRSLPDDDLRLTGVLVADQVKNAARTAELRSEGIWVFDSYRELLETGHGSVDVISLPTSIHTHASMAVEAMEHGYDVLLEKPPTPTVEQHDRMRDAVRETNHFCSIGFQYMHSPTIRRLKQLIVDGELGSVEEIACKGYWPRTRSYYERNPWAGRQVYDGNLVLDGPMHNAFAHYLQNMLFLAGTDVHEAASPTEVTAELYRGHTYTDAPDTTSVQLRTDTGVDVSFYVTHAPEQRLDPYMEITATEGSVEWRQDGERTLVDYDGGETLEFDNRGGDPRLNVLTVTADYATGDRDELYCTPENTRGFVEAVNAAYRSARWIHPIPEEYVSEFDDDGEYRTIVEGMDGVLDEAFEDRKLISETGVEWGVESRPVDASSVERFRPFSPE
ncbi:MAG: Gfo/Idh/MocA family protein [Haloarculaceae archaeon]